MNRGTLKLSKNEYNILRYQKLTSKDPVERLYALQMLGSSLDDEEKIESINNLLYEENAFIIKSAMEFSKNHDIKGISDAILSLINHEDATVQKMAIYEYARINVLDCVQFYKHNYENDTLGKQSYYIGAAIKYGGLNGAIEFGKELMRFIDSDDIDKRKKACQIIADIANKDYYHPLLKLLKDPDRSVRKRAIIASGHIQNSALIDSIVQCRTDKSLRTVIREALTHFPDLHTYATHAFAVSNNQEILELLSLFDKNSSEHMTHVIADLLKSSSFEVRKQAVNSLYERVYQQDEKDLELMKGIGRTLIKNIDRLIKFIPKADDEKLKQLTYNEVFHIQLRMLFQCLSFKYGHGLFKDVIENCYNKLESNRALALELLDNSLNAKDKLLVVPLIEAVYDLEKGLAVYDEAQAEASDEIIMETLNDGNKNYSAWMTANCIRFCRSRNLAYIVQEHLKKNEIHIIKQETDRILQLSA
jgi:HEAT repeat protein